MSQAKEQVRVSVVMATYNGERYLEEQLLSIRNQTYTNLEIIVVDDASTDNTVAILRRHAEQDKRIQVLVNAVNQGTAATFETGFTQASGEFIAISDQDDIWLPEKIAVLLEQIKDSDAIYTDSELIDGDGRRIGVSLLQKLGVGSPVSGQDFFRLLCRNCVSGHAMLLRRSLVAIALPLSRDEGFIYDQQLAVLAMLNAGLGFYARPLTLHRMHDSNQVNHLMKSDTERQRDRDSRREGRRPRYIRMQEQLQNNIAFLRAHVARHSAHYEKKSRLPPIMHYLGKVHDHLAGRNRCRFNISLFLLLLRQRHRLFYFSRKHPVLLCSRLARGYRV